MFGSLFSDRYNKKRENFYDRYEAKRLRYPNLPVYKRPKEPLERKPPRQRVKKLRQSDYDYDEWIAGNFVSIVVRRAVEQWSCSQLMETAPIDCHDVCSWRSWPTVGVDGEKREWALRRSRRLTDKPNLKPKDVGNLRQQDKGVAIKWQQPRSILDSESKMKEQMSWQNMGRRQKQWLDSSSILVDGSSSNCRQQDSTLQCNMCGNHFSMSSELQLHSLDDCRRNLLATLKD